MLLFDNSGQALPVLLDCALRNTRDFPDTLAVQPTINVTGKSISFTPQEVGLAARRISASVAEKSARAKARNQLLDQSRSRPAGTLRKVYDVFDLEHTQSRSGPKARTRSQPLRAQRRRSRSHRNLHYLPGKMTRCFGLPTSLTPPRRELTSNWT